MADKNAVAVNPTDLAIDNKFIDGLSAQLTQKEQYGLSFPPNYSVSNALNSAYLILQETLDSNKKPVLQSCSKQSIASSLIDMTVQGLNPVKKQCYFVGFGGKLKLMRSYQGTMAVAKRAGVTKTPVAQIIYEGDTFEYHIENGLYVIDKHVQDFMNIDNSKIKGAYAIVDTEDYQYVEIMNINQIEKAWSKGYGYKKGAGVHGDFADQMAKKTVISRACRNIINSSDDANLQEAFDNTSENEHADIAVENMQYDIKENANSEEFVEPDVIEPERIEGEIVDEPTKEPEKKQDKPRSKPASKAPDVPDWMQGG